MAVTDRPTDTLHAALLHATLFHNNHNNNNSENGTKNIEDAKRNASKKI